MGRPKGSKNKSTTAEVDAQVFELDEVEETQELEASEEIEIDEDADDDVEDTRPPKGMTRVDQVADSSVLQAIREQTAALTAAMPPRKVPFARFKTRSKFNPDGKKRKLKFIVYQNGYRCNPKTLTDTEFALINSGKIRPGQYLSKIVTVRIQKSESAEDQDKIFLSYNNKTPDQKLMNKDHWNGFTDLLQKIVAEVETRQVRMQQRQQHASA